MGGGWQVVRIVYIGNNGGFLPLPPWCGRLDNSCTLINPRATPATSANW
jgi:hypothetical protein